MQKIWRESRWLENVNVLNKPGGGGALAYTYVSQHAGDGHYIAVVRKGLLTNHILGRSPLHYTELTPLAVVANEPNAMAVRADSPLKNVEGSRGATEGRSAIDHDLGRQHTRRSFPHDDGAACQAGGRRPAQAQDRHLQRLQRIDHAICWAAISRSCRRRSTPLVPHHKSGAMRILGVATAGVRHRCPACRPSESRATTSSWATGRRSWDRKDWRPRRWPTGKTCSSAPSSHPDLEGHARSGCAGSGLPEIAGHARAAGAGLRVGAQDADRARAWCRWPAIGRGAFPVPPVDPSAIPRQEAHDDDLQPRREIRNQGMGRRVPAKPRRAR